MSESLVVACDVEETFTQVLTQLVQDGGDEDQMSVELLQEQVELNLEYSGGSLSKWQNFLGRRLREKSKKPVSVDTALTPAFNLPGDRVTVLQGEGMEW